MKSVLKLASMIGVAAGILGVSWAQAVAQEIKIGVLVPQTGMAANFGKSVADAVALWPKEIDGTPVRIILRDDRSDVTASTMLARQLISDEKVDALVGLVLTPSAVANAPIAEEGAVPFITSSPVPKEGVGKWIFDLSVPVSQNASLVLERMVKDGIKTVGMIGYSDTWGDQWNAALRTQGEPLGITVVADERYARTDTSVVGQALKLISLDPDAVLIAASYAGAAVPVLELRERAYAGKIYHSNGMNRAAYMKAARESSNGVIFPTTPFDIAEELPEDMPSKPVALSFKQEFEALYGSDTSTANAAIAFDVGNLLKSAVTAAKKEAAVGTPEFRDALRVALETGQPVVGAAGVYEFAPDNHFGLSNGSGVVLATVKDGKWEMLPR